MIRLFVADDHSILRDGLKHLFALVDDIAVVGEAASGAQVLDAVRCGGFDLLLLDMNMPGISGVDLIFRICSHGKKLPILVLSMHNEPRIAKRALLSGAAGYLTKDCDPECLLAAIRKVANGGRYVDPLLAEQMAFETDGESREILHDRISEREVEVLALLAEGWNSAEIACRLHIATSTVEVHRRNLMRKLDMHSVAALTKYAIRQSLITV
ncbi:MAG: response regulator transcription factor [Sterolibacterium sp.]